MAYQVFARKLRPGTFDGIVGQEHAVKALRHALDNDRLHHAYLFTGTRGVGKTTIARILAKCLNCEEGVSAQPCCVCTNCKEIAEGRFMDLLEVDAASRTGVDDTRDLLENVQYRPARGRYKVYLIDEVHMLSKPSFNALLKTLEEPPDHVKFILATTDPKKIPMTVLSRCLQFQLKNMLPQQIAEYLEDVLGNENIAFEPDALKLIARNARGSMRDALSITDQAVSFSQANLTLLSLTEMLGTVAVEQLAPLIRALIHKDGAQALAFCEDLGRGAVDFQDVLSTMLSLFHKLAVYQSVGTTASEDIVLIKEMAELLSPEVVQLYYQIALIGSRDLHLAPDPRCGFEMILLRLLAFQPAEPGGQRLPERSKLPERSNQPERGAAKPSGSPVSASERPSTLKTSVSVAHSSGKGADNSVKLAAALVTEKVEKTLPNTASAQIHRIKPSSGIDWHDVVGKLKLEGVTRMVAENASMESSDAKSWNLCIDKAHEMLVNDKQINKLQKAVADLMGDDIAIRIEIGLPGSETPAAKRIRVTNARQEQAVRAMQADPNVRQLIKDFDAELQLASIKPINSGGK